MNIYPPRTRNDQEVDQRIRSLEGQDQDPKIGGQEEAKDRSPGQDLVIRNPNQTKPRMIRRSQRS